MRSHRKSQRTTVMGALRTEEADGPWNNFEVEKTNTYHGFDFL